MKDITVVPEDYIVRHEKTDTINDKRADGSVVYEVEKTIEPLVRCKDCKQYKLDSTSFSPGFMICSLTDLVVDDDCYCWWGERKEEDERK